MNGLGGGALFGAIRLTVLSQDNGGADGALRQVVVEGHLGFFQKSEQPVTVLVHSFVTHYNTVRLHSALGYVTPKDKLEGREAAIFAERDRKLEVARERRRAVRQQAREKAVA